MWRNYFSGGKVVRGFQNYYALKLLSELGVLFLFNEDDIQKVTDEITKAGSLN